MQTCGSHHRSQSGSPCETDQGDVVVVGGILVLRMGNDSPVGSDGDQLRLRVVAVIPEDELSKKDVRRPR